VDERLSYGGPRQIRLVCPLQAISGDEPSDYTGLCGVRCKVAEVIQKRHFRSCRSLFRGLDDNVVGEFKQGIKENLLNTKYELDSTFLPYFPSKVRVPDIAFIVARTDNDVIGCDNRLPWRLGSDLARFRDLTLHHAVIMGRKTFESIGKPLPRRFNIVITRDATFRPEGVATFSGVSDAVLFADVLSYILECEKIFVIGGAEIFHLVERSMSLLFLTQIHDKGSIHGDAYFHYKIDRRSWAELYRFESKRNERDDYDTTFHIFKHKTRRTRSLDASRVHAGLIRNTNEITMVVRKYENDRVARANRAQLELDL
jgi:dihydrofolate reductase